MSGGVWPWKAWPRRSPVEGTGMVVAQDDWREESLPERARREWEEDAVGNVRELTSEELRALAASIAEYRESINATWAELREAGL